MIWSWMKYENCKKIVRIERRSRQAGKTCKRWLMCEVYMTHMNIFIIFLISSWENKSKTFDIAHLFWVLYTYTFIPVVWASVFVFTERDIKVKLLSIKRYHNKLLCAKDCNCIFFLKFDLFADGFEWIICFTPPFIVMMMGNDLFSQRINDSSNGKPFNVVVTDGRHEWGTNFSPVSVILLLMIIFVFVPFTICTCAK